MRSIVHSIGASALPAQDLETDMSTALILTDMMTRRGPPYLITLFWCQLSLNASACDTAAVLVVQNIAKTRRMAAMLNQRHGGRTGRHKTTDTTALQCLSINSLTPPIHQ